LIAKARSAGKKISAMGINAGVFQFSSDLYSSGCRPGAAAQAFQLAGLTDQAAAG
jgi:hypothetical protein